VLFEDISAVLPTGLFIPREMKELFDWINTNNNIINGVGYLGDDCPTRVEFSASRNSSLKYWFGHERPEVIKRLCVFCKTGADGSMAALWLADDGTQKVVHLGSGSGSIMNCILADSFIDFIRLLAIGYDEIAWESDLAAECTSIRDAQKSKFYKWVVSTYGVKVPAIGSAIVRAISLNNGLSTNDEFSRWIEVNV